MEYLPFSPPMCTYRNTAHLGPNSNTHRQIVSETAAIHHGEFKGRTTGLYFTVLLPEIGPPPPSICLGAPIPHCRCGFASAWRSLSSLVTVSVHYQYILKGNTTNDGSWWTCIFSLSHCLYLSLCLCLYQSVSLSLSLCLSLFLSFSLSLTLAHSHSHSHLMVQYCFYCNNSQFFCRIGTRNEAEVLFEKWCLVLLLFIISVECNIETLFSFCNLLLQQFRKKKRCNKQ